MEVREKYYRDVAMEAFGKSIARLTEQGVFRVSSEGGG